MFLIKKKKNNHFWGITLCIISIVITLLPLAICSINSFRSTSDLLRGFFVIPKELTIDNYTYIIEKKQILRYLLNSIFITTLGTCFSFIINPFVSYKIATNWDKKTYRFLYVFFSSCMFIPGNLLIFPLIKIYYSLNLMNTTGLLLYYAAIFIPETIFMLVPYFRTFNKEIGEAAQLDGCSPFKAYVHVFLPVCKPFIATIMILNAIWLWNDFLMPLMILNKNPQSWTLPIFIYNFLGRNSFQKNYAFASCQIALLPIILFYGIFHKKIISGLNIKSTNR